MVLLLCPKREQATNTSKYCMRKSRGFIVLCGRDAIIHAFCGKDVTPTIGQRAIDGAVDGAVGMHALC